ncbi:hypothetical protein ACFE33_04555 [Falsihalocynthiibacter sp. SS001]|uniref:hypothetical protein n=1 Tax=Falsihalocynthiibacter sp. SS001 TaxID=3349698 RepID=UPI0036D419AC
MIAHSDLIRYFSAYPETPPRTTALEQKIKIGVGFHNKWYRSQKEHWLGWMFAKDCELRSQRKDPTNIDAQVRWRNVMCSPAMFWIAECASVSFEQLDEAENAAILASAQNPKDGHPHGRMMREVLPWNTIEAAMITGPQPVGDEQAQAMARVAFERLCEKRSEFRKLRQWAV